MSEKLKSIRSSEPYAGKKKIIIFFISVVLSGFIMGIISKYSDTVAGNAGSYGAVIHCISYITTEMGIWIFLASVIAMYSYKSVYAMMNSIGFFLAMLAGYYLYSRYICGFYSTRVILYWTVIAFASSVCAWIVWYGKGNGLISDVFAAMPTAVLFVLGRRFYSFIFPEQAITQLLDLIFALVLIYLFTIGHKISKGIRILVLALFIGFILSRFHIIGLLYGGF